ncbi:hypothetical protein DFH28DRAFT_965335 [Melampsora americana]|nr:hypothetical protein DFH28DRAFT_965335 [Melampsora americana]
MSEDLFSVLAAIGIIALVYRWFTTSPSVSSTHSTSSRPQSALQRRALAVSQSQVDRLITTFPQLTENEIRYALVTTTGGVEAVAERVLIQGGLPPPPPNFFPTVPNSHQPTHPNSNTTSSSSSTTLPSQTGSPSSHTNTNTSTSTSSSLISRLCLESYKREQDLAILEKRDWRWEESQIESERLKSQENTKELMNESSSLLKDRKSKMVLESRWRMLQKDRKGKSIAT